MALNMSDPAAVMAVYSSIIDNENNWLLLHYINDSHDEVGLYSYGSHGLEEMKTKIPDMNRVFIAFYREEVDVDPGYIVINYIPSAVSGVRKARALVHARRVGTIFNKHQSIFTVDSLSLVTASNVREAIINPDTAFQPAIDTPNKLSKEQVDIPQNSAQQPLRPLQPLRPSGSGFTQFADATNKPLPKTNPTPSEPLRPLQPVRAPAKPPVKSLSEDSGRKSFGTLYAPEIEPPNIPPLPPMPKGGGSVFTSLLRRKKEVDDSLPPPTPPKDDHRFNLPPPVGISHSSPPPFSSNVSRAVVQRRRSRSMSDYAIVSHVRESDEVVIEPETEPETFEFVPLAPLESKWSQRGDRPSDPAERARKRRELQLQREKEEREASEQEAERQERLRREKERFKRQEEEEEARRKSEVEREIRRITAERKRREQMEQMEEERHRRELEERKRQEKEKRLEEHRRLDEWRNDQARKAEAAARQAEEKKKKEEVERKKKIQKVEAQMKGNKAESELSGWVTIQSKDGLSWKRRYYRFAGSKIFLYRSPKDMTTALDQVELRDKLRGLREWFEGYDDLEAISFSFVVEFKDGEHWSMFGDSEEDKYKVLGLFKIVAGL